MKIKTILISLLLPAHVTMSSALEIQPPPEGLPLLDLKQIQMDMSRVPTGILSDVGTNIVEFNDFDGKTLRPENYVDFETLDALINGLSSSKVSGSSSFPSNFSEQISQTFRDQGRNPVGVIVYKYSRVKEHAVAQHLITVGEDDSYSDAYSSSGEWINPYEQEYLVAFSPYMNIVGNSVTYSFSSSFRYSNLDIKTMMFDAGDGKGFRNISLTNTSCTVSYQPSAEPIEIKLRITLADNTVLDTHSYVSIFSPNSSTAKTTDAYQQYSFTASKSYSGYQPSAIVSIKKDTGLPFKKPFIVAEGFDPISDRLGIFDGSFGLLGFNSAASVEVEDMVPTGYELIYIDWLDSCAPIEANADILEQVIRWVNDNKDGTEKNILMGQSMGGLIARYALCEMEENSIPHKVGIFISHDVPHLGANIPLGYVYAMQHLLAYYGDHRFLPDQLLQLANILHTGHTISDISPYRQQIMALRNAPSVQQMLIYYVNESFTIDQTLYINFQNQLNKYGFPKGDKGKGLLNLCLTNGGTNNYTDSTGHLLSISGALKATMLTNLLLKWLSFGTLGVTMGSSSLSLDVAVSPFTSAKKEVFKATCKYIKKYGLLIHQTHTYFDYHYDAPISLFYPDKSHGSYYSLPFSDIDMNGSDTNFWFGSYAYDVSIQNKFMFIPTLSSLCYTGNRNGLTNTYASVDFTNPKIVLPQIPFDGYKFVDIANATEHIEGDPLESVINLVGLSIAPSPIEISSTYKFTIDDSAASDRSYTVKWSISDETVASIRENTGILSPSLGGTATVYADIQYEGWNLRLKREVRVPKISFPGFPEYKLSYSVFTAIDGSDPVDYAIKATAQSSIAQNFSNYFVYHWGYKENQNSPIIWTTTNFSSFSQTIPVLATARMVYFYAEYQGQVSPTYSILCKLPPTTAIMNAEGELYIEGAPEPFAQVKSTVSPGENCIISCMGHDLFFEGTPAWADVYKLLLEHENFVETVKNIKPWGEENYLMIPFTYTTEEEHFDDFLLILFDDSISSSL